MEDKYIKRIVKDDIYITVKKSQGGYEVDIFHNEGKNVSLRKLKELIPELNI